MGSPDHDPPTLARPPWERWAALFLVAACIALSLLPLRTPNPAETPFPTDRALDILGTLARAPHPVGTAEHRRVRERIVAYAEDAGAEVEVQKDAEVLSLGGGGLLRGAEVHNVVARLPGRKGAGAVLLVAHYDTVQTSPGAADDGAGVAALLTVLEVLGQGPPPANDVIFLFSDAEEPGLLGARAFVHRHPWAGDVGLVVNLEARGVRGPSVMFETGPGTGPLVRTLGAVGVRPLAASYSYDVYRHLPNDTDFTIFKEAGLPGFNFAVIGGLRAYHSRLDDLEHLDVGSLRHHGANALALARHFADADLASLDTGAPRTYFNLPLAGLVVYPNGVSPTLAVAGLLLALILAVRTVRRDGVGAGRVLAGTAAPLGLLAIAGGAVFLVDRLLLGSLGLSLQHLGDAGPYLWGEVLLALGLALLLQRRASHHLGTAALGAGALLTWSLLAAAMAVFLTSSSYLLVWPVLGALGAAFLARRRAVVPRRTGAGLLLVLPALPLLLLWPPTFALLGDAFGLGGGVLLAAFSAAAVSLSLPQLAALAPGRTGLWSGVALGLAGLGVIAGAVLTAGFGEDRPQGTSLMYALDAERGEARWATLQWPVDPWAGEILGAEAAEGSLRPFFGNEVTATVAPAPLLPLPPPEVELLESRPTADGGRLLRLHARSLRGAPVLRLDLGSEAPLRRLTIAGRDAGPTSRDEPADTYLIFYGLPAEGLEVEMELGSDAPLAVTAIDQGYDLESLPGVVPRGPGRIPHRHLLTDLTLVRRATLVL